MKFTVASLLSVAAVLLSFSSSAVATPLVGNLRISGQATVSNTDLDFACEPVSGVPCVEADEGNTLAGLFQTGDFTAVSSQFGLIKDLNNVDQPIGPAGFVLDNFITFPSVPGYNIVLTNIAFGDFGLADCLAAPAGGQTCTPPGSAFNLSNGTDGAGRINSTANFQVSGIGYKDSQATGYSFFTGTFSADFNVPYQDLLAQLASGGGTGTVTAPYSARFDFTPIPEPGSMSLMLFGGIAAFTTRLIRRRRQS